MIHDKHDAILSLKPNGGYNWPGFDYKDLVWESSETKPTEAEIDTEVTRLNNVEPVRLLRKKRDELLVETDWVVTKATETGVAVSDDWKTYRQALRDLPASSTPTLDSFKNLDLTSVTWPTKPS